MLSSEERFRMTRPLSRTDASLSLLEEERLTGRYDSSGRFTLDPNSARPKLARYQLKEPDLYLLKLIQAGVLVDTRHLRLPVPGLHAVVRSDHLKTDLSGLHIRENESYQETIREITCTAQRLKAEVLMRLQQLQAQQVPFRCKAASGGSQEAGHPRFSGLTTSTGTAQP